MSFFSCASISYAFLLLGCTYTITISLPGLYFDLICRTVPWIVNSEIFPMCVRGEWYICAIVCFGCFDNPYMHSIAMGVKLIRSDLRGYMC